MWFEQDVAPGLILELPGRIISKSWGTASFPLPIPILAVWKQTTQGTNQLLQAVCQSLGRPFPLPSFTLAQVKPLSPRPPTGCRRMGTGQSLLLTGKFAFSVRVPLIANWPPWWNGATE